jgi:hypothetical protein
MTFQDVCQECLETPGLVKEWNRLTGHHLGEKRDPIIVTIDKACGYNPDEAAMPDFLAFVYECIWLPLVAGKEAEHD